MRKKGRPSRNGEGQVLVKQEKGVKEKPAQETAPGEDYGNAKRASRDNREGVDLRGGFE